MEGFKRQVWERKLPVLNFPPNALASAYSEDHLNADIRNEAIRQLVSVGNFQPRQRSGPLAPENLPTMLWSAGYFSLQGAPALRMTWKMTLVGAASGSSPN